MRMSMALTACGTEKFMEESCMCPREMDWVSPQRRTL
jgi:hypothetical protein